MAAAEDLRERIRAKAAALGFAAARVTTADAVAGTAQSLAAYLAEGRHGDMTWMATHEGRRAAPRALWPEAKSVVVLGENYAPAGDPLAALAQRDRGNISVYARGRDYHDVLKRRLKALARWLAAAEGGEVKVFADTAPVMEKPLAARAGLGWQGRHTNLVSRRFGSWLFLGEIFTTLEIAPDPPEPDRCGTCRACEQACPTRALAEGRIEPRRCVSYLTIEHKGEISADLRPGLGNRVFGCDDCLAVCPWNRFATPAAETAYAARPGNEAPPLAELAALDDAGFRARFAGSPIKRLGRARFLRNVLIAIGNSGEADLAACAERLRNDPSDLVREAAAWAAARLGRTMNVPENMAGPPGMG